MKGSRPQQAATKPVQKRKARGPVTGATTSTRTLGTNAAGASDAGQTQRTCSRERRLGCTKRGGGEETRTGLTPLLLRSPTPRRRHGISPQVGVGCDGFRERYELGSFAPPPPLPPLATASGFFLGPKAREKQLEEAKRVANLQKRRELKAAGVDRCKCCSLFGHG